MNIIYVGESKVSSTSGHRHSALARLGHSITILNPYEIARPTILPKIVGFVLFRTGYRFIQHKLEKWLTKAVNSLPRPDLIWVDNGELLGPRCVQRLKEMGCPVILFNVDDPTGNRDKGRFDSMKAALTSYDLVVTVRSPTAHDYEELGAKQVLRVMMSYDEVAHRPFDSLSTIPAEFRSEVAFIGTWMRHEHRDEFLLKLIRQGVNVSIWGDRWSKSPHWEALKPHYRGAALYGRDYVAAVQGAKLCLGLLSKGNRDLHTTRSLEIPYAGGLLCAERTSEHLAMYKEGEEAAFWADADECAAVCLRLLADDTTREQIRAAGERRVRALAVGNEDIARKVLDTALANQALAC